MTNPPSVLANNSMTVDEGCASIADNSGNLLFYTDGMSIWTKTHTLMANGTGLNGGHSSTQAALILKKPGSSTIYYVYTVIGNTWFQGLNYSVVDMSLASGQGSVTAKNVNLFSGPLHEKLAATRHCNGTDFWILVRDFSYTDMNSNGNFHAYQLSSVGMNTTAVTSAFTYSTYFHFIGAMKISPNGRKLACANYNYSMQYDTFELFDFDNSTGVVSNSVALMNNFPNNVNSFFASGYGVEFSPDCTKLYGALGNFYATANNGNMLQWDLCAGAGSLIAASQTTISSATGTNYFGVGSLQLASNGKIYVAHSTISGNQEALSVINNPNAYGSACNFVYGSQTVTSTFPHWGLPNFSGHYFLQHPYVPPPFTYTASTNLGCLGIGFSPPVLQTTLATCPASTYSISGYAWNFGDLLSGTNNISFLPNPTHAFSSPGTYTTQLVLYYSCGGGTDTLRQSVSVSGTSLNINTASITCASLGSGTVSLSAGSGNNSYTWIPTNQTSSVATGLIPGNYTISVHDNNLNCTVTNTVYFAPLIPLTGNVNNSFSITCYGASTGTANCTDLAGGSANQNYLWSNGNITYTNSFVTGLSAGVWSITITDALTACQINSVFTIVEPTPLMPLISSASASACAGSGITLSGTCSGGIGNYSMQWSTASTAASINISQAVAGNYIYTLTATDANSCSVTDTIMLQFVPKPILSISHTTVCPLETGTIVASGATNYTWSNSSTNNYLTDNPATTSTYTVIGTAMGCTNSTQGIITVKTIPNLIIDSNSPVCEGTPLTFSVSNGLSYNWNGINGFSSVLQSNMINVASLNHSGLYQVTVTVPNSCTATASASLHVKPLPIVSIANSNQSLCVNVQTITLSSVGNAVSFIWTPTLGLSNFNQSSLSVSPVATKIYTLSGALNGCTSFATATVNVIPAPVVSLASGSNSLCLMPVNNSPNSLIVQATGAQSYTITAPPTLSNSNPNGPQSVLTTLSPYTFPLAFVTITLTGSNGVCSVDVAKTVSVIPNPTVALNNLTPLICEGQEFTYTASGADSYFWQALNQGNSIYSWGNNAVANPVANGTNTPSQFSVYGIKLGCRSAVLTTTISVNPLPFIEIFPKNAFVCSGYQKELSLRSNATSFNWSPPVHSGGGTMVSVSPSVQSEYTVTAGLNGCTNTAVTTVSVMPLPKPFITVNKNKYCVGEEITLTAGGALGYSWIGPENFSATGDVIKYKALSVLQGGQYTLTASDGNNCLGQTTHSIGIVAQPQGYLKMDKDYGCVPHCINFTFTPLQTAGSGQSEIKTMSWHINQNRYSGLSFSNCFQVAGKQAITGEYKDMNDCVNTLTVYVNSFEKPKADFTFSPLNPVEETDEVSFTSLGKSVKHNWYVESLAGNFPVSASSSWYQVFHASGTYPVVLVEETENGCSDTIIKLIQVKPDFVVYVPDAFTPNADNNNELFRPVIRSVKAMQFSVFDKWGHKLFETTQPDAGWDGTFEGRACKQDVYVWKLNVWSDNETLDERTKTMSGKVLLHR